MAWPNISERREAVRKALRRGHLDREAMAARFGCSIGAIHADVVACTAPRRGATIHTGARLRALVMDRDGRACQYCGGVATVAEHVIPQRHGGVARPWNLVAACQPCNARKGSATWLPRNLDEITSGHPEWRALVLGIHGR